MLLFVDGFLPSFLHVRRKKKKKKMVEDEGKGNKSVSFGIVGEWCSVLYLKHHKVAVVDVVVGIDEVVGDGDIGTGHERFGLFVIVGNLGRCRGLLLLPLHALNLELGFDVADDEDEDEDDCVEDPDSDPCCAFPLPAFNEAAHFFLVGC